MNAPAKDRRPLSLKDSCLSDRLQEMEEIGVACGKIEGRMRRPGYVRTVTGIYAKLLNEGRKPSKKERQALEEAFSRSGFTEGYWLGRTGPEMFGFRPEGETSGRKEEAKTAVLTTTSAIQVKFVCRVIAGDMVVSPLQVCLDSLQLKGRGEELAEAVLKKEIMG